MTNSELDYVITVLNYIVKYRLMLKSDFIKSTDYDEIQFKRITNDVENIYRYLNDNKYYKDNNIDTRYELFSPDDIHNLYDLDDELYHKNRKTSNYRYIYDCALNDCSFDLFLIKIVDGVFEDISFIFNAVPLIDMLYKYYEDKSNPEVVERFFNIFKIKDYKDFEQNMNKYYDIISIT